MVSIRKINFIHLPSCQIVKHFAEHVDLQNAFRIIEHKMYYSSKINHVLGEMPNYHLLNPSFFPLL